MLVILWDLGVLAFLSKVFAITFDWISIICSTFEISVSILNYWWNHDHEVHELSIYCKQTWTFVCSDSENINMELLFWRALHNLYSSSFFRWVFSIIICIIYNYPIRHFFENKSRFFFFIFFVYNKSAHFNAKTYFLIYIWTKPFQVFN